MKEVPVSFESCGRVRISVTLWRTFRTDIWSIDTLESGTLVADLLHKFFPFFSWLGISSTSWIQSAPRSNRTQSKL